MAATTCLMSAGFLGDSRRPVTEILLRLLLELACRSRNSLQLLYVLIPGLSDQAPLFGLVIVGQRLDHLADVLTS